MAAIDRFHRRTLQCMDDEMYAYLRKHVYDWEVDAGAREDEQLRRLLTRAAKERPILETFWRKCFKLRSHIYYRQFQTLLKLSKDTFRRIERSQYYIDYEGSKDATMYYYFENLKVLVQREERMKENIKVLIIRYMKLGYGSDRHIFSLILIYLSILHECYAYYEGKLQGIGGKGEDWKENEFSLKCERFYGEMEKGEEEWEGVGEGVVETDQIKRMKEEQRKYVIPAETSSSTDDVDAFMDDLLFP